MLFSFAGHTIDRDRRELRRGGQAVAIEPQVFDLLLYLIDNRHRVVSKDDLIAAVWKGRIVSDATLTSRIHAARKAVGDSAEAQQVIRTIPRRGIRFVAELAKQDVEASRSFAKDPVTTPGTGESSPSSVTSSVPDPSSTVPRLAQRASLAIMPFADKSDIVRARGGAADALVHDVITRLAKLRSLFVIAEGTVFALSERGLAPSEAARMLNVDYVASGSVRLESRRLNVDVELVHAQTSHIVWAESFDRHLDDAFTILEEIGGRIVTAIAHEIETVERNRAVLKPPNSLNAWEAYHRGLWHMYRFNKADNEQARHFFEMSLRSDRTFARAYSGLSFTHFQNAFQGWTDTGPEVERAYAAAADSLMSDDRDPAAHWAMGRALWLQGRQDQSVEELEHAVELSPHFAMGHYTLAFVRAQSGDAQAAIASADFARRLSPHDPLLFGMLMSRALALTRLYRFQEASEWAIRAADRPNAHPHIRVMAACILALGDRTEEARARMAAVPSGTKKYCLADLFRSFQLDESGQVLFRRAADLLGLK